MDPIVAKLLFGFGVMATGAAAWGLLKLHGRTVVNGRFQVRPDPAPLHGSVRFQIQVQPRGPMRVSRVVARTVCWRRFVERHGGWDDAEVEHDEVGRSEVEICGAQE